MDSEQDVVYRLKLAEGFLREAEEDLTLSRWRSCVDNAQLSVENAAKAVIAAHAPVPRSHDVSKLIADVQASAELSLTTREKLSALAHLAGQLGYEEHVRSDYGEEASFTTPWELFDQEDAQKAVAIAGQALSLAREVLQHPTPPPLPPGEAESGKGKN